MTDISIGKRQVGPNHPCYIIAEMSANHNQDFDVACRMIYAMKEAGADAVKLQTYTPDTLTIDCDNEDFLVGKGTIWEGKKLYELYKQAYTPWDWQPKLFELARELGMQCFSSPFDKTAVDFLEKLDPPAHKIASFELVDLPLIEYIATKGRPIIMSTGMASFEEIEQAVEVVHKAGVPLALLKCTSAYPARPASMNLRTIPHMANSFDVPTGLSDHTLGIEIPIAAVALGACIIEKHFTLSRDVPGPDSSFSLEPHEFKSLVDSVRNAEQSLGKVNYTRTANEEASRVFRRSLYVVTDMDAGEPFTEDNVKSIRPGYGLPPKWLPEVLGCCTKDAISRGTALTKELFLTVSRSESESLK